MNAPNNSQPLLEVRDLRVSVEGLEILRGINLTVYPGEVHAIMGSNGSGKSTLVSVLAGKPDYTVTSGQVLYEGEDLLALEPDLRARKGVFLAFQYPLELPGVRAWQFLKAAVDAQREHRGEEEMGAREFDRMLREKTKMVDIDPELVRRAVNEGFSGGEKKKNEVLQMAVLEPKLALMDETDSGLDIDALTGRGRRGQPPAESSQRHRDGHPLSADSQLHRPRSRSRPVGRPHRPLRRPRTGPGAGRKRLRLG